MYEFKGNQYTAEQLQSVAEKKGYTFDELLEKNPNITELGKTQPTTQQGAEPVDVIQAPDTELPSEDISLGSQEISNEEKRKLPYLVRNKISTAGKAFTKDNVEIELENYKTIQERPISEAIKKGIEAGEKDLNIAKESFSNRLYNFLGDEKPTSFSLAAGISPIYGSSAERIARSPRLQSAVAGITYAAADIIDELGFDLNKVKESSLAAKIDADKKTKKTIAITEAAKASESGVFTIIESLLGAGLEVGYSVATGAATGGAMPLAELAGNIVADYNLTKAKTKHKDLSEEDAVYKLIQEKDTDIWTPLAFALPAVVLERAGLKATEKMLNVLKFNTKNISKSIWLNSNVEGGTEWLQGALETSSKSIAKGGDISDAALEGIDFLFSKNGLESYLQGLVGSGVIGGAGALSREVVNGNLAARSEISGSKLNTLTDEIVELNQKLAETKSDTVKESLLKQIKQKEEELSSLVVKANGIINLFSDKDYKDINDLERLKQQQIANVKKLSKDFEDGLLNAEERAEGLNLLKQEFLNAQDRIKGIVKNVSDKSNKSAQEVQNLYDKKPAQYEDRILELYRPMAEKLAMKRQNVPGFDKQLLTDEILTGQRGVLDLLRSYKPDDNPGVPLPAYINKFIGSRAIEASNRILDTDFKLDVTEAKGVTDTTTEKITEQVDAPQEVQKLLSDELKLSDETSARVLEAVEKTLGTKLPSVDSKDFKKKLRTGFRNQLVNVFKQEAGKGAKYNEFISDVYDKLLPLIPQETLNRKLSFAVEPVLDPKTGKQKREKTKEGKKIFKRKDISKAEFIKYFTDTSLKGNVKGARKTSLAEILADEIGMDKVLPVLSKPEVFERFKQVQELQGQQVPENVLQIISEKIDRLIQSIENFQKSDVARASLGIIEITANATVVMLKTIRAAIKAGASISNAIRQGIEKAREILSRDLTDPNVEIVIDVLSSEITEETIQNISESEIKRILTTLSEDYDLTDKGADFLTEVKKEFPELSEILNNKEYLLRRTVKGQKIFNKELGDKTAAQTKLIIESLPKELHNINSAGVFGEMFGLHMRYLDTAKLKKSTGKPGLYYDTFKKENLNILSLNSLKNNLSDNAFKAFSDIDFSKIELQNISKGSKSTDFIKKVAKIAAQNTTKENKQLQVDKLYDAAIGNENKKLARALAIHLKDLYQSKKINDTYLLTILQGQTNLALGFRALTGPLGFELKDGAQDTSKWKGEHLKSSSEFNFQLLRWIKNSDSTVEELTRITNDFNQVFGDKSIFDIIDEKLGKTSTLQLERFTKSLSENQLSDFYIPSNQSDILQYAIDQNKAKYTPSKNLDTEFNQLLQATTGVEYYKEFSPAKARLVGRGKGKRKFFIPYSADDFVGLLYATLGKGKVGDKQMAWYEENLLRPFSRGIQRYEAAKQKAMREWMALSSEIKKDVPGGLNKRNETGFRNQDSLRMYIWAKQGMDVPGAAKSDINESVSLVNNNPKLKEFAERLIALNPEGYPAPGQSWDAGDITTDIVSYVNDVRRGEFLTEWKQNVDQIFTDKNKQKLLASYGQNYVDALEDILHRMKTGRNRKFGITKAERTFMDWTNNSVGAIMFFNARSAVLQTLSAVNFINFSDNNPINAGLAFANQPQYWKDFATLFNSDFLKQRRTGLQTDVNADEIANAAKSSTNKAKAALSAILKLGFTPTQIADSFAIASGGATFYRNRVKKYIKEGLDKEAAEKKAFTDFQEVAEETQQSARPDRISMQQASSLGRLILAFGNTPMQYARLTKKAALDLINGRGDWKTNISKIAYYSVIQNIIFSALQQGLFALLFDEEDEEKEKSRYFRIGNSSIDTLLRGSGVYGAAAATVKNMILEIIEQSEKSRPDYTKVAIEATTLSPPINSKLRKLESAGKTFTYKQSKEKVFTEGFSFENPAFLAGGRVISAVANLPVDRVVQKADHIYTAMQDETELWQSIALSLGWSEWDLNMIDNQTKKSATPSRGSGRRGASRPSRQRNKRR